jgi:hypothetical protein
MKIKVQIEPTTIASIKVKPCGERKCCALVDRSAADGTAVRDSAYLLYVLLLFAPGPLVQLKLRHGKKIELVIEPLDQQ